MIVRNNKKRVITVGVNLTPGVNTLNKKDEEIFMKEIETAERYAELKIITFMDKDVINTVTDITSLPTKEALPLIKETLDVKQLGSMFDSESNGKSRNSIIAAIEKQIDIVRASQKKKDEKED